MRDALHALCDLANDMDYMGMAQPARDLWAIAALLDTAQLALHDGWGKELSRQTRNAEENGKTLLRAVFAGMELRDD